MTWQTSRAQKLRDDAVKYNNVLTRSNKDTRPFYSRLFVLARKRRGFKYENAIDGAKYTESRGDYPTDNTCDWASENYQIERDILDIARGQLPPTLRPTNLIETAKIIYALRYILGRKPETIDEENDMDIELILSSLGMTADELIIGITGKDKPDLFDVLHS